MLIATGMKLKREQCFNDWIACNLIERRILLAIIVSEALLLFELIRYIA